MTGVDVPKQVLLVEDDDAHVRLLQRAFAAARDRFELVVAQSLHEARRVFRDSPPALLIVDLLLSDGRGTELLPGRNRSPDMPIIMLTSHGDETTAVAALKDGALDYVVKSTSVLADMPRIADRVLREWGWIKEKERVSRALRENEARLRLLVQQIPAILWTVDTQLRITSSMGLARRFSRHEMDPRRPLSLWEFLEIAAEDPVVQMHHRALRGEAGSGTGQIVRADTVYDVQTEPLRDETGSIVGVIGIALDVTQQRRTEERMRIQQEKLAHAARLSVVGQMVAEVAHEIGQPLFAIGNFASATQNILSSTTDWTPEQRTALREWVNAISDQVERARGIVGRLRSFARRNAPERHQFELNEAVLEAIELVAAEGRRKGVTIESVVCEPSARVYADRVQIQQVVINLIRNSFEALDQVEGPRRVIVRTTPLERTVEITVADNGTGLRENMDTRQFFEAFLTTKPDGLGLGLSISQSIVHAHDGQIWARPGAEGGAQFGFSLPLDSS